MKTLDLTRYVKDGTIPVRCMDMAIRFMVAHERRRAKDSEQGWMEICQHWKRKAIALGYRDPEGNEQARGD